MNLANDILILINESNFSLKIQTNIYPVSILRVKKSRFLIGYIVCKRVKQSPHVFAAIVAGRAAIGRVRAMSTRDVWGN